MTDHITDYQLVELLYARAVSRLERWRDTRWQNTITDKDAQFINWMVIAFQAYSNKFYDITHEEKTLRLPNSQELSELLKQLESIQELLEKHVWGKRAKKSEKLAKAFIQRVEADHAALTAWLIKTGVQE